jgi:hypothetical protein
MSVRSEVEYFGKLQPWERKICHEAEAVFSRAGRGGAEAGGAGMALADIIPQVGISEQTFYRRPFFPVGGEFAFRFHRWLANLRVLEIDEIKSVSYAPASHPFVARLIGTIRREYLDRLFFWIAVEPSHGQWSPPHRKDTAPPFHKPTAG